MSCEYVRDNYKVPAEIGRRVSLDRKLGVISEDRGHYLGVNFDEDKPGVISTCHPTWKVEYRELGAVRASTKSQQRYARYREYGDGFDSFIDYCRWDSDPERSWNS